MRGLLLALALAPGARAQAAIAPRPWPHEGSDLVPHPALRFGALDNGLRYAWMDHPAPAGTVHLRLHVAVGSLAERDEERGLAHVLGHLAYAGSAAHPGGSFGAWFAQRGLAAGPHVSSTTGYDATIHAIDLDAGSIAAFGSSSDGAGADPAPDADERARAGAVGEALGILAEIAGALELREDALARVLDEVAREEAERDTPAFRAGVRALEARLSGSRVAERLPLGTAAARAGFTAARARDFYARWFRPDLMTVIVAGDLRGIDVPAAIAARFGALARPSTPTPPPPERGRARLERTAWVVDAPDVEAANLSIESVGPWRDEPLTRAAILDELPLSYARRLLEERLLARAPEAGLLAVTVTGAGALRVLDGESIGLAVEPALWQGAIAIVEHELRAARMLGFEAGELLRLREAALAQLDAQVADEPARSARSWTEALLLACDDAYVPTSAAADRAAFAPAIGRLTPEACRAALDAAWDEGTLLLTCVGDLGLVGDAGERLRAVWERAAREPVERGPAFAYASSPDERGAVASRSHARDVDVHLVRFDNGVLLNLMRRADPAGQVLVSARVGEGLLTLEPSRAALAWAADFYVNGGGLRAHPPEELAARLAGRQVGLSFTVAEDHFAFGGTTSAADLLRQCELLAASITEPGWHASAREALLGALESVYAGQERQLVGPISTRFQRALHGGDARFGLPPREQVEAATIDEVRAWLEPELSRAPIEVTIVGDVDVEAALDAAARTFGALPGRRAPRPLDERRRVRFVPGLDERYVIDGPTPAGFVLLAFPAPDGRDAGVRRRLNLLAPLLARALHDLLLARGLPVEPSAGADGSRVFPGLGKLFVQIPCPREAAQAVRTAALEAVREIAARGIDAASLEAALEQERAALLATIAAERTKNGFWLGVLSDAQSRPDALDELRAMDADYRAITAAELSLLARQVLDVERVSTAVVTTR